MNQVTFIIDHPNATHNRLDLCGQLLRTWIQQHKPAFCLTKDAEQTAFINRYLWSEQFDFLPHSTGIYDPAYCQVTISDNIEDAGACLSLFNFTNQAVKNPPKHHEIIEWVSNQPKEKVQMRDVFAQYKAQSITPNTVRM